MTSADPLAGLHIIDTDTHWSEPHDLWTSRVPASQRELVPHVIEVDGSQRWVANQTARRRSGSTGSNGASKTPTPPHTR